MKAAFAASAGDVNVLVDQAGNRNLPGRVDLLHLPAIQMFCHLHNFAAGDQNILTSRKLRGINLCLS